MYACYKVRDRVAFLIAEIDCRKPAYRHISNVTSSASRMDELLHGRLRCVRFEPSFLSYPVGAFARDRSLGQLVTKLNFELCSVKAALTAHFRDKKLASLLADSIRHFHRNERRCRKNKLKAIYLRQLRPKRFKCIDRKTRCCDLETSAVTQCSLQVITEKL